jgi:DNA-binding transcriptional MocR family regulator
MTIWIPELTESGEPLYQSLMRALQSDIENGTLSPDTRLPTQRELADSLKIAIGTVTRAYAEAERRGLIRSEGRRGTFVGGPRTGRSMLASLVKGRPDAIDLSKNHPSYELDPDLGSALRELSRSRDVPNLLAYPPSEGLPQHREAGARWLRSLGAPAEADSVFVTAGAQHALSVVLAAESKRGDIVCTDEFTYLGVRAIAQQYDLQVMGLAVDDAGIRPDNFAGACRHHRIRILYCMPTISNPTNRVMSLQRREEIAGIAAQHGVTIIEDEIMRPLVAEQSGYIAELLPEQTYLLVSTSKGIAAGLRVGFVIAPTEARQRMIESLTASCIGVPPLTVEVCTRWIEDGTAARVIERRRKDVAARHALAERILDGFTVRSHPCSYHCWLELPEGWSSVRLSMEAQSQGVIVAPAEVFAVGSRLPYEAVRISMISADTEQLERGLTTLTGILRGSIARQLPTV